MSGSFVPALLEERRGYVGKPDKRDRLAAVDAELAKFGVAVSDDGEVEIPDDVQADIDGAGNVPPVEVPVQSIETADAAPDKSDKAAAKPKRPRK